MKALLLTNNYYLSLYTLQCLRGTGVEVHVMGSEAFFPARFSWQVRGFARCEEAELERFDEALLARVNSYCAENDIDVVMPCGMESSLFVASFLSQFSPAVAFPSSNARVLADIHDKWTFALLLRELGVSQPGTAIIREPSDLDALPFAYPIMLKPLALHSGKGVLRLESPQKAREYLAAKAPHNSLPLIAQEYVSGYDMGLSVLAKDGVLIAWDVQKTAPDGRRVFFEDAVLVEAGRKIIARSGYTGIAHFDIVHDEQNGERKFLECNPRVWGSMLGSRFAGINYPLLGIQLAAGQHPHSVARQTDTDFLSVKTFLRAVVRGRPRFGDLRRSDLPEMLVDPLPYAALVCIELFRAIKNAAR